MMKKIKFPEKMKNKIISRIETIIEQEKEKNSLLLELFVLK